MKRYLFFLAPVALSLSGCAGINTASKVVAVATSPTPIAGFTVADDKAWNLVLEAYNVPANAYQNFDLQHMIRPALKAVVKPKLQLAWKAVLACRDAKKIGDVTTFNERYSALVALKADIMALLPKA